MKKFIKHIVLLLIIFIVAGGTYFFINRKNESQALYKNINEPSLPVIMVLAEGKKLNVMYGYKNSSSEKLVNRSITLLPDDRKLTLNLAEGNGVTSAFYEVRSIRENNLVERMEINLEKNNEDIQELILPIQNLIDRDTKYRLNIILTKNSEEIYYYTDIYWTDKTNVEEMIWFAEEFSAKTIDLKRSAELAPYVEVSPDADSSNLGYVNIQSTFRQITWNNMHLTLQGEKKIDIVELHRDLLTLELKYMLSDDNSDAVYNVKESIIVKWTDLKMYIMAYERTANQIFEPNEETISKKAISLGMLEEVPTDIVFSEDKKQIAFNGSGNVWLYSMDENIATSLFSFKGNEDIREAHMEYGVKILSVDNYKNVDFLIYGYMNRGMYEGEVGVAFYKYNADSNALEEYFFIPSIRTYEMIKNDIDTLFYVNSNGLCYLYFDGIVYAIDIASCEHIVVAENVSEGRLAVNKNKDKIAWVKNDANNKGTEIKVLYIEDSNKKTIVSENGEALSVLGFVDDDLVYGTVKEEGLPRNNRKLLLYDIKILDDNLDVQWEVKADGKYIVSFQYNDDRTYELECVRINEVGEIENTDSEVIIKNIENKNIGNALSQYTIDELRKKLYYIPISVSILETNPLKVGHVVQLRTSNKENKILLKENTNFEYMFLAFRFGKIEGVYSEFYKAANKVYGAMGNVVSGKYEIIIWRGTRLSTRTNQHNLPMFEEGMSALDFIGKMKQEDRIIEITGSNLMNILLFVSDRKAVVSESIDEILLIKGYDRNNVTFVRVASNEEFRMSIEDAEAYFDMGNKLVYTHIE
jgi:hypothetical protein